VPAGPAPDPSAASLFTAILFGLAPSVQGTGGNLTAVLNEGGRGGTSGRAGRRVRNALVVSEVALAVIVLIGAGLLMRSFLRLRAVNPGFRPEGVLTVRVPLSGGGESILFESNVICEYLEESQPGVRLHPEDALERAQHRAWMEFGSAILVDLWGYETAREAQVFEQKRQALIAKFERVEAALGHGPYFAGARFSLVDAVFAPIFRYFDVFDPIHDGHTFDATPKVRAWRQALAVRPSVQKAVTPEYAQHLRKFLQDHQAHLLTLAR